MGSRIVALLLAIGCFGAGALATRSLTISFERAVAAATVRVPANPTVAWYRALGTFVSDDGTGTGFIADISDPYQPETVIRARFSYTKDTTFVSDAGTEEPLSQIASMKPGDRLVLVIVRSAGPLQLHSITASQYL